MHSLERLLVLTMKTVLNYVSRFLGYALEYLVIISVRIKCTTFDFNRASTFHPKWGRMGELPTSFR